MAQEKILSVSVAAYNATEFLPKCLDSFLACQRREALEVIIVDDGSKDDTRAMAEKYAAEHPEVFRVLAKENGGHGSTINASLRVATGKYYRVIDSDDWVNPKDMDQLLGILSRSKADMVVGNFRLVYQDHEVLRDMCRNYETGKLYTFDELEFCEDIPMHALNVRTDKLRNLGVDIPEHVFYADVPYLYNAARAADTVEFEPGCVYQYRLDREGQSVSAEGMYRHIEDLIKVEMVMMGWYVADQVSAHAKRQYLLLILQERWQMLFSFFLEFTQDAKDSLLAEFYQEAKQKYPAIVQQLHLRKLHAPLLLSVQTMLPPMRVARKVYRYLKRLVLRRGVESVVV